MPIDPRAQRFLEMTAAGRTSNFSGTPTAKAGRDIIERREALKKLMGFARADQLSEPGTDILLRSGESSVPGRLYHPGTRSAEALLPAIVFLHGGGLVAGSIDTHDLVARGLCAASGCRVISVEYRLAPEHPYPAAFEDAAIALDAVIHDGALHGVDGDRVALCGESGGGALAVLATHDRASAGKSLPALVHLICPVLDFGEESASRRQFAEGYLIDRDTLEADLADYLGAGMERSDPRISPLRLASLAGLPRFIVHTAEYDPLRDEGDAFARRLEEAGVSVVHHTHDGMVHNFHALGAILPQGREMLAAMGREIGIALGSLS